MGPNQGPGVTMYANHPVCQQSWEREQPPSRKWPTSGTRRPGRGSHFVHGLWHRVWMGQTSRPLGSRRRQNCTATVVLLGWASPPASTRGRHPLLRMSRRATPAPATCRPTLADAMAMQLRLLASLNPCAMGSTARHSLRGGNRPFFCELMQRRKSCSHLEERPRACALSVAAAMARRLVLLPRFACV